MQRYLWVLVVVIFAALIVPKILEERLLGVVEVYETQPQASSPKKATKRITRIRKSPNGHFVATIKINGHKTQALVDTGASLLAVPYSIARKAGLRVKNEDFTVEVRTANGITSGASVFIPNLYLGPIHIRNVKSLVLKDESLSQVLLGMSALNRLGKITLGNRELVITPR
ncbi:TIGR02281 family clan AA aspartic protease [Pseudovibrio sp. Tun.PSC04-5.I4]|uniref:retropepsin-like aspartic protease family protein n=1 Tax=Pseudovibrio sp. Tun.PSC04-5.I4 TaxID=1798213 RepID=UPI000880AE0B|nr:TIGR02281 family clan AA aspartic protease [Pseudovibrio sp. Tun.PSC04-5.I4]SDR18133.1 aspartyl protease family protein [Pseudovibrio sp. Tun.PSC04-5.I4]